MKIDRNKLKKCTSEVVSGTPRGSGKLTMLRVGIIGCERWKVHTTRVGGKLSCLSLRLLPLVVAAGGDAVRSELYGVGSGNYSGWQR